MNISNAAFNILRPRQDGQHLADDIFKCICVNGEVAVTTKMYWISVYKGPFNSHPAVVQMMACCRTGDKIIILTNGGLVHWRLYAPFGLNELIEGFLSTKFSTKLTEVWSKGSTWRKTVLVRIMPWFPSSAGTTSEPMITVMSHQCIENGIWYYCINRDWYTKCRISKASFWELWIPLLISFRQFIWRSRYIFQQRYTELRNTRYLNRKILPLHKMWNRVIICNIWLRWRNLYYMWDT